MYGVLAGTRVVNERTNDDDAENRTVCGVLRGLSYDGREARDTRTALSGEVRNKTFDDS